LHFGIIVAPIIGGVVDDKINFQRSCEIFTLVGIIFGCIYTVFNVIPISIN
jgi:MFS-type transporter involved in bile tolerance (Atg22 family)